MKVGNLVQWYTEYADAVTIDYGLILKIKDDGAFVHWLSGNGSGWFDIKHPSIGVLSESR